MGKADKLLRLREEYIGPEQQVVGAQKVEENWAGLRTSRGADGLSIFPKMYRFLLGSYCSRGRSCCEKGFPDNSMNVELGRGSSSAFPAYVVCAGDAPPEKPTCQRVLMRGSRLRGARSVGRDIRGVGTAKSDPPKKLIGEPCLYDIGILCRSPGNHHSCHNRRHNEISSKMASDVEELGRPLRCVYKVVDAQEIDVDVYLPRANDRASSKHGYCARKPTSCPRSAESRSKLSTTFLSN
jgi:hypothetical protein